MKQRYNYDTISQLITDDDVREAIKSIDDEGVAPQHKSKTRDLLHNGKRYPPKEVIRVALRDAGVQLDNVTFNTSIAIKFLRNCGYQIVDHVDQPDTSSQGRGSRGQEEGATTDDNTDLLNVLAEELEAEGAFDPKNHEDDRIHTLRVIVQRQGQPEFRRKLIDAYDGKCAVTGCDAEAALEAAHISAYRGPSTNPVSNGLLLRADIHTLFDRNLIGINPKSLRVSLARRLRKTTFAELDDVALTVPMEIGDRPDREALEIKWRSFNE